MMRIPRLPAPVPALAALLLASGCAATSYISPVEVTRFVGTAPASLGQGSITLQAASGSEEAPEFATYSAAIEAELASLGYTIVPANGAQTALVSLEQFVIDPDAGRSPVTVGGGASVGSYGSGVGLGVGLDLTPRAAERIETLMAVAIRDAAGGPNLWEGRASMTVSVNSEFGDDSAAAARIANALFDGFPGQNAETLVVE